VKLASSFDMRISITTPWSRSGFEKLLDCLLEDPDHVLGVSLGPPRRAADAPERELRWAESAVEFAHQYVVDYGYVGIAVLFGLSLWRPALRADDVRGTNTPSLLDAPKLGNPARPLSNRPRRKAIPFVSRFALEDLASGIEKPGRFGYAANPHGDRFVSIPSRTVDLVRACDGQRTVRELALACAALKNVRADLERLRSAGVVS
jgi:hypothetical protein